MAASFTPAQWSKIHELPDWNDFGLPRKRRKSVVIGTFNIRKLGAVKKRSKGAWAFFQRVCETFDLLAIQEVMDDMEGLRNLHRLLGPDWGLVVSDVTGGAFNREELKRGARGNTERLAFLFRWKRIQRTELASDISYDRSDVVNRIFRQRRDYSKTWRTHIGKLAKWEEKKAVAKAAGKRKPGRPPIELPDFLTFIRQPHCASFEVAPKGSADPLRFLAVNAHLLYGVNPEERRWEFDALIDWLTLRAKNAARMYYPNLLLLGDCNLEFERFDLQRMEMDARLKELNSTILKSNRAAKVNLPLLTPHPSKGELRTTARMTQTYDQIGIFSHDPGWPQVADNAEAGQRKLDDFDYGVFRFTDLFAQALHGRNYEELTKAQRKSLIKHCEHDVSDHMPAWFRLRVPGTS